VLWEDRCTQVNKRKRAKYEELLAECKEQAWQTWNFTVEVGCRGFGECSVHWDWLGDHGRELYRGSARQLNGHPVGCG